MAANAPELVGGYPSLAHEMGLTPEYGIIRRFATLNSQNLLYRQAEIIGLENKLRKLEKESASKPPATQDLDVEHHESLYSTDWYYLGCRDVDNEQWRLFQTLREKLEQYDSAVVRQVQMAALPHPSRRDIGHIREKSRRRAGTRPGIVLTGWDRDVWGDPKHPEASVEDLMVIRPRPVEDPFSTWVVETLLTWLYQDVWYRLFGHRIDPAEGSTIKTDIILRITSIFTMIVACLLPIGSIAVLYCVQTMRNRLELIAGFTVLFALSLLLFTSAKRSDVFAATAAFAAVEVVFISGNNASFY